MHLSPRPPQDDEFYMDTTTTGGTTGPGIISTSLDDSGALSSHYYDPMDDIFGSEPGSPAGHGGTGNLDTTTSADEQHHGMTADFRRLRAQHNKEGYREGIMAGKSASIQQGFDEGYSVGANVGLKAGQVLGLLEGIAASLASSQGGGSGGGDEEHAVKAAEMYSAAKEELGRTEEIFGEKYWRADGWWKFDVPGVSTTTTTGNDDEVWTASAEDVANAHPLIVKWTAVVDEAVARWGLDLELPALKNTDTENQDGAEGPAKTIKLEQQSRQAMDW